jgi:4-amino-4-deoxy-L-arabinose transferase-like glycosyltransferase
MGGRGGGPGGMAAGSRPAPPSGAAAGTRPPGAPAGAQAGAPARGGGPGGSVSTAVTNYLLANQGSAKYLVAASGSRTTAPIIIATGKPVVTIGGFGGHDPAPTVTQLASMVASGQLKYVLVGGFGGPGGGGAGSALTTWVTQHGTVVSAAGTASGTLYRVSA